MDGWLTLAQAAQRYGVKVERLKAAAQDGRLRATKPGERLWLVREEDVTRFLAERAASRIGRPVKPPPAHPGQSEQETWLQALDGAEAAGDLSPEQQLRWTRAAADDYWARIEACRQSLQGLRQWAIAHQQPLAERWAREALAMLDGGDGEPLPERGAGPGALRVEC